MLRLWSRTSVGLVALALVLAGCGDDGSDSAGPPWSVEEVADAYEAASGAPFEESPGPGVAEVVTYTPTNFDPTSESEQLDELNSALGDSAVLFQVHVHTGEDPPSGLELAESVITYTDVTEVDGGFEGENIFLVAVDNVLIQGPPTDNGTFERFAAVIEDLSS